jgi:hypothetical protein
MSISADPAAFIRFAISAWLAGTGSALWEVEACDDIDDTAESMEEFRGMGRDSACCRDIVEEYCGDTPPVCAGRLLLSSTNWDFGWAFADSSNAALLPSGFFASVGDLGGWGLY